MLLLPAQDIFGWRDRINCQARSSDANWTWRMPWPVDVLEHHPEAAERAATLASWMKQYGEEAGFEDLGFQEFRIWNSSTNSSIPNS